MESLTYVVPETPTRPFAKGDAVEVMDRQGAVIGRQVVKFVAKTGDHVRTDCGRDWTGEGWWLGENDAYPFPWIRHARSL